MAIICKNSHGWLVDQNAAVQKIYNTCNDITCRNIKDKNTTDNQNIIQNFCLKKDLFSINHKFIMDSQFEALKTRTSQISDSTSTAKNSTEMSPINFLPDVQDNCQHCISQEMKCKRHELIEDKIHSVLPEVENSAEGRSKSQAQCEILPDTNICKVISLCSSANSNTGEEVLNDKYELASTAMNVKQRRKRKRKTPLNQGEIDAIDYHNQIRETVYTAYKSLINLATDIGYFVTKTEKTCQSSDNNARARNAAGIVGPGDKLMEMCHSQKDVIEKTWHTLEIQPGEIFKRPTSILNKFVKYRGSKPIKIQFLEDTYIVPPNSSFFLSDFNNIQDIILCKDFNPYDLILLDPPWQNRSVKRKKKYWSLTNEDLLKIPIPSMLKHRGIVALWVTNKLQHINFIKECMFPTWNIKFLTTWHWIKVTTSGEMVYDFDSSHKKPYEVLVFGQKLCGTEETPCEDSCLYQVPENKIIISIPCSIHSVKPPLNDIFEEFLPDSAQCLELFARNLWPGWTSWGNEVLKHQHLDFYEEHVTMVT